MNPWKIATIAIAVVTGTAFTAGLTTAYLMRPAAAPSAAAVAPANASSLTDGAVPIAAPEPRVTRIATVPPASRPARTATVTPAVVRPVSTTTATAADCSPSTGDRVWRVA